MSNTKILALVANVLATIAGFFYTISLLARLAEAMFYNHMMSPYTLLSGIFYAGLFGLSFVALVLCWIGMFFLGKKHDHLWRMLFLVIGILNVLGGLVLFFHGGFVNVAIGVLYIFVFVANEA